jgi:hypothetical protein
MRHRIARFPADLTSRHSRWFEIIGGFARLDLPHNSDRLPAISGIAKMMGHGPGGYYAGL